MYMLKPTEARAQLFKSLRDGTGRDGTGPHGRGAGPGKGKGCDTSTKKSESGDTSKVDPKQLSMGIKVEMEHTTDRAEAKKIALDHLKKDSKYYSKTKA